MYSPAQLARLLRLPEPTPEQAAVIAAPLGPLAVIAGAGSGKSETMAARLVWLVANGMVRPERVLGLTFTRKAAAEFADRVRSRLERLRRAGLDETQTVEAVIIGTADQFHVPLCRKVIAAGKPVLVEKPLGVTIEECEALSAEVHARRLVFQWATTAGSIRALRLRNNLSRRNSAG